MDYFGLLKSMIVVLLGVIKSGALTISTRLDRNTIISIKKGKDEVIHEN